MAEPVNNKLLSQLQVGLEFPTVTVVSPRTVNEFDIYVGTSAGAFISSLTANGVTPEEMMRVLNRDLASPLG